MGMPDYREESDYRIDPWIIRSKIEKLERDVFHIYLLVLGLIILVVPLFTDRVLRFFGI